MKPRSVIFTLQVFLLSVLGTVETLYAQEPFLKWATVLSDPAENHAYSIATDAEGSVYTMGFFAETMDADPGPDEFLLTTTGNYYAIPFTDIFVQKLDSSGNLNWAIQLGGSDFDGVWTATPPPFVSLPRFAGGSVATDADGNVLICGIFFSDTIDLDPGPDVVPAYKFQGTLLGRPDYMVVKLDNDGGFIWGHTFGGAGSDRVDECVVDHEGNIILVGEFSDTVDFDPSPNGEVFLTAGAAPNPNHNDQPNLFVQKLDADGNLVWAKQLDGPYWESPTDVDVDSQGNIYVTGAFVDTVDFDPGPGVFRLEAPTYLMGEQNTFLLKLDADGNFVSAFQIPGTGTITESMEATDHTPSLTVDGSDNVILSSVFADTVDVDPTSNYHLIWPQEAFNTDRFLLKLSGSGNLIWVGQANVGYLGLDTDGGNAIYATGGAREGFDVDPGLGVTLMDRSGILVTRLDSMGNLVWAHVLDSEIDSYVSGGQAIVVGELSNVNVAGIIRAPFDFDPSLEDTLILDSSPPNFRDGFNLKWGQRDIGVGVQQPTQGTLVVYPNPATQFVYVESHGTSASGLKEIQVYNNMGQEVYSIPVGLNARNTNRHWRIDVSSWANGLYHISIVGNDFTIEKNILKL